MVNKVHADNKYVPCLNDILENAPSWNFTVTSPNEIDASSNTLNLWANLLITTTSYLKDIQ